ncbi:FCD domain-containing protein [Microbispora rosea]|uniref:FCD domain-containing protein n=1 Tax=Microbispora rosea TaxID=58117 RepID=A0A1N7FXJ2_9ACTN|nr:FCD domain-containing protein [Microbispora rosea]GIH51794.1 hypothetical protein Mro03_69730 [Microbispora rosea subsp. rosea]SIS05093.1 FCD domain-containing protein [Microbispora rosea]
MTAADWAERLSTARPLLDRASTAELVADVLRENVVLETASVRAAGAAPPEARQEVRHVDEGQRVADVGDWVAVGTANMRFHRAIAALLASPRVDETMARLLAELRLAFHVMGELRTFHEP